MAPDSMGYLYPVEVEPVTGVNGGAIEGPPSNGRPLTAVAAAALIEKEVG